MIGYQQPVTQGYTDIALFPFLQTYSEVGEERDEFNPRMQINLPKEACHIFLVTFFVCSEETPDWKTLDAANSLTSWFLT